jgi:3',5'-cyclic AMP phosphodiesterase CpdA
VDEVALEVWTVADDEIVATDGPEVLVLDGLEPGTGVDVPGLGPVRTLERPPGERLATVCTVNDVHFGEVECGRIESMPEIGPVLSTPPGEEPYPEMMSRVACAAISEVIGRSGTAWAVVAKGDLTATGSSDEYEAFLRCYGGAFGDRLTAVRGNHDAMGGLTFAAGPQGVPLPGVVVAVLDTVVPGSHRGWVDDDQLDWLDELARQAELDDRLVLVLGHHHPWDPASRARPDGYFGIHPDASERLVEVVARRPAIVATAAGHTHRNRVRRFLATGDVPHAEVASTKDFPGSWAEYRIHEGGVLQVHRRLLAPESLAWSERCRTMVGGLYAGYASGGPGDRCLAIHRRLVDSEQ